MAISAGAILGMEHADWPGNVRELANVVGAGVVRAHGESSLRVEREHLFPADRSTSVRPLDRASVTFHEATRRFQEEFLREALDRAGWNITAVARALDLTRGHIYNLMATLRIQRPGGGLG